MSFCLRDSRLRVAPSAPNSMGFSKVLSAYSPHPFGLLRVLLLRQRIAISCKRRTEILFISDIIAEPPGICKSFCAIFHKTAHKPKSHLLFAGFLDGTTKTISRLLFVKNDQNIQSYLCRMTKSACCWEITWKGIEKKGEICYNLYWSKTKKLTKWRNCK